MESFLAFVHEWGYIAVFLGAIVEGETVILTASATAFIPATSAFRLSSPKTTFLAIMRKNHRATRLNVDTRIMKVFFCLD